MERVPYRVDATPDGRSQYGCPFCAYSQPDTESVRLHVKTAHVNRGIWFIESSERSVIPMADAWTLKTDPFDYLKSKPDGPHADLARRVLADRKGTKGLRQTIWRATDGTGLVNYECTMCRFATIDKADAEHHVITKHGIMEAEQ